MVVKLRVALTCYNSLTLALLRYYYSDGVHSRFSRYETV